MTGADTRCPSEATPLRVLLALHGYEPAGWAQETGRVVSTWTGCAVRVLAVLDVPCPPFTSMIPAARRAYGAARADWQRDEEIRLQRSLDALLPGLPREAEIVRAPSVRGDLVRTIAEHADHWRADVVVVGAPAPGLRSRLWPGRVHERVLRRTPCTVLVTMPPVVVARRQPRLVALPRAVVAERGA